MSWTQRQTGTMPVHPIMQENARLRQELAALRQGVGTMGSLAGIVDFSVDSAGLVSAWGREAEQVFGRNAKDIVGRSLISTIAFTNAGQVASTIQGVCASGTTATLELSARRADGGLTVALMTVSRGIIMGRAGAVLAGMDITRQYEREVATRRSLEKQETRVRELEQRSQGKEPRDSAVSADLESFLRTANAAVIGTDAQGRIVEWNTKVAALSGIASDEVLGKLLVQEVLSAEFRERVADAMVLWPMPTAEFRAEVQAMLSNCLNGLEVEDVEIPLFTKDEERPRIDILLNATPRRAANGTIEGVILLGLNVTDRNRIEEEKARVANELQIFIDTANAPIFGIDADGLVNEWNLKAAEITGYSKEEVMGKSLVDVYISEDFRATVRSVFDNALQGLGTANFEFPIYTKDQRRVEVLLNATPRCNVQGEVIGVVGVGQDITERKEVEIEKARVAQELQTFIDTANAPIFGIDENGFVNEWNNKSVEITGFSREEVFGQDLVKVYITEEYRDQVAMVLTNALQGEETANFEFPLFTKNEQRVEVLLNATTRRDVTGRPIGVIGVGQDITLRKQIEQEKSRVAQELQTFINTANAPIFGCDAYGLVNEWNNKAHQITGYSKEEVLGKNLVQVYITKEFRASVKQVLDDALKGEETANFEFALFTKDNKRVEVLLNATTRRDVTGTIIGMIGVGQDITEKRRLMEQEALLFQAQAANDAKSQFLATMSHEMRTPLNVIMGMNDLIIETNLNSEQRTFAEQVKTSAESLLILINDILDLTKVEAGKLELVAIDFDIRQVMEDSIDSAASKALGKGLEICSYMNPDMRTMVNGDPDRLRQILLNLLSNGIKFTKEGQVYMLIEAEEETASHHAFRFKVYDSGIGISKEGQKKLFSRFSQVDSSTTRTYGGTGLGLAISKQFAELMDGSMGVQSEIGRGSLFWFTAVFKKMATPRAMPALKIPKVKHNKQLTALLKADNDTLRNILTRSLEALGLSTTAVDSLDKTVALLSDTPVCRFDILFFCPSICDPNPEGAAHLSEEYATGGDLHIAMGLLAKHEDRWPVLETIVLCPINHLGHASGYRRNDRVTILPRPVRLLALHDAVVACAMRIVSAMSSEPQDSGSPVPAATPPVLGNKRVLVAVSDMCQRIVLRAVLTRDQHACVLASSGAEAVQRLAVEGGAWNHDLLVIDARIRDRPPAEIVAHVRAEEARAGFVGKPLEIIGAVDGSEQQAECAAVGISVVCSMPFNRGNVQSAMQSCLEAGTLQRQQDGAGGTVLSPMDMLREAAAASGSSVRANAKSTSSAEGIAKPMPGGAMAGMLAPPAPKMVEGNIRVLVVDDDSGQRMVMKAMLSKMGFFDITVAENGQKALALISESLTGGSRQFDVALMDGFMPGMSGWECTAAVRELEANLGAPDPLVIIGVTGATENGDERRLLAAGMTDVTHKPMTRDALVAKISLWVVSIQAKNKMELLGLSSSHSLLGTSRSQSSGATPPAPAKPSPSPAPPAAQPAVPAPAGVPVCLRGPLRILVVDDQAGSRTTLKALLTKDKHKVEVAKTGDEALTKLADAAATFHCAIVSFSLGSGVSGCDAVRSIRAREAAREAAGAAPLAGRLFVIGVTTAPEQHALCLAAGMDDSLPKPPSRDALAAKLAAIVAPGAPGAFDPAAPPAAAAAAVVASPAAAPTPARGPAAAPKTSARILIVEDHWANRKLIEAMLLQRGHTLDLVENGQEAVAITNTTEYDLVLMDCNMPIMDGWQATEKIRQRRGLNASVPIIAVTANAMKGDRDKCIEAGMDDYISKPVERKKLYEIIAKWTTTSANPSSSSSPLPGDHAQGAASQEQNSSPVALAARPAVNWGGASGGNKAEHSRPAASALAAATPGSATGGSVMRTPGALAMMKAGSVRAVKMRSKAAEQSQPKILLVDDDDTLRLLVKSRLEKDSSVVAAGDGEEALEFFKKSKFDIVISDVFMPKMDGFELCRQIRKIDRTIPIVMLTSMNDVKDRIKGLDAGADDYIVKPFAPKELEARVRSLLRRMREENEGTAGGVAGQPAGQSGDDRRGAGRGGGGVTRAGSSRGEGGEGAWHGHLLPAKVWELDRLIALYRAHLDVAGVPHPPVDAPAVAAGQ